MNGRRNNKLDIKKTREELRKGKTIYDMPLRVAYYARVSTDKDDQLNSLENQQKYFEEMISENKNWISCGGYIDEGISGTAVKNRVEFLKMIEAGTLGKIDLILTKEISRFSRNTVDSIKYTEYLLKNGVIVYFLSDNLNTIGEDAEFRLTIMSSLAQDEIRKLSERVKFGVNRMIKDRKLIGGNLTGYYKKDGKYQINPDDAPLIKYLFETYATGSVSLKKIAEDLKDMGYLNSKGDIYSTTSLTKFLTNPRYKGFYTARLTEVEDYKTHKKKKVPKEKQIIEKDDRVPAIVSEEIWDKANELYERRRQYNMSHILNSENYIEKSKYSCLIYCKECGNYFIRAGGSNRKENPTWACKKYKTDGVGACASPILKEEVLDKIFTSIFEDFIKNKKEYLNSILQEYKYIIESYNDNTPKEDINKQIDKLEKQKDKLLDLSLKGIIDDFEFKKRNDKFNLEIYDLQKKLNSFDDSANEYEKLEKKINEIRDSLSSKLNVKENLHNLMKLLVERVEVKKINGDRNHLKIVVYFNFKTNDIVKDLEINNKAKKFYLSNFYKDEDNTFCGGESENSAPLESKKFIPECSSVDTKEPRVCNPRTKTR